MERTKLEEIVDRTGWSAESQVEVLLSYIENQGAPEAFCDFLEERAEEEESLSLEDLTSA